MSSSTGNRLLAGLLDQQLWCFGQDIRRKEGNLLCQLGMCRIRPPRGAGQSTLYLARLRGDRQVYLWGFGVLIADASGNALWVKRYTFDPFLLEGPPAIPVHSHQDLGARRRPFSRPDLEIASGLVRAMAEWMGAYEHWVAENLGAGYRQKSLLGKPTPPVVRGREMALAWERVARRKWRPGTGVSGALGPWGGVLTQLRSFAGKTGVASAGESSGSRSFLKMTRGGGGLWVA
jgi:hypothetical protein